MRINADFARSAFSRPADQPWVTSPQSGVERVMLDRVGAENARATSLVRYAPGSNFPHHRHIGGEEILVLSGTFSANGEDFPAGWYLRNPPGSSHAPSSTEGTVIFVKLQQMLADEQREVCVNSRDPSAWTSHGGRDVCLLFSNRVEEVCLLRLQAGQRVLPKRVEGAEMFLLSGEICIGDASYPEGSWIRLPAGDYPAAAAGPAGADLYLKCGRLGGPDAVVPEHAA